MATQRFKSSVSSNNNTTTATTEKPTQYDSSNGILGRSANFLASLRAQPDEMAPFAGRLGGNQTFVLDRSDPDNTSLLARVPDAAPNLTVRQSFDMRGFAEPILYKAGIIEFLGTFLLVFASNWFGLSPNIPPPPADPVTGVFGTAPFIGACAGAVQAGLLISLLVYGFGSVSGAHFNPLITIGTFCARLTTFPRMTIYVGAQVIGSALAGLMVRAGQQSRDWKIGGCFKFEPATTGGALAVEIMACLLALFLAFGVGLDPRQRKVYGPALAPALVGLVVASLALSFAFALEGYGGASLNPGRCLGAFVGSRFPSWHWIHWVGTIVASVVHGLIYFLVPPETFYGGKAAEDQQMPYIQHGPAGSGGV